MTLNLISGPRNVSTALMYAFGQRSDTQVSDEPFYAVYLARSGAQHPGREAVRRMLSEDESAVRTRLFASHTKPILFVKNMAHHMEVLDEPFPEGAKNIFLIRDPQEILASYSQVIERPVMRDIGIASQYNFFGHLTSEGEDPVVLDAGYLLRNPEAILSKLCEVCGIPYEQRMLHWPAGPKPYDGVWAPYWYARVHRTTGFEKPVTNSRPLPEPLRDLLVEARVFYEKLLPFALKA